MSCLPLQHGDTPTEVEQAVLGHVNNCVQPMMFSLHVH